MPVKTPSFVKRVFAEVPATYEVVNHVLTLGLDILWRRQAAGIASQADGGMWADMCTGTGEMAVYLNRLAPKGTKIIALDLSLPMLEKATAKPGTEPVDFVACDIRALPISNGSLDLITMSFATRNANINRSALIEAFAEYCRVLKPGASLVNLETSRPVTPMIRWCFDMYVKLFVKAIGSRISGSSIGYAYLAKTIPRFYSAEELADIMRSAGFGEVSFQRRLFGVVAIHKGRKS